MYYILNENQARLIALDFQHLIGEKFGSLINIPIEQVVARQTIDGKWNVYLLSYMGDKDETWELYGDATITDRIFRFLTDNQRLDEFDPNKYGLSQEDKTQ